MTNSDKEKVAKGPWKNEEQQIRNRMSRIDKKLIVLSGKGGVGKSTVAVNLAFALMQQGHTVGLLDIDIHGPSIPKLLGLEGQHPGYKDETLFPVELTRNLRVMSIGFLLEDSEDAVIWRGPLKMKMIQQFLKDVDWGELDYLIVDSPPGTGDEPLSVIQLIGDADGAVIVTTPQDLSIIDVQRSIGFCKRLGLPIVGVIENMSGFVCPKCGERTDIFKSGGGERMSKAVGVPFLGSIPIDPAVAATGDEGKPYLENYKDSETAKAFNAVIKKISELDKSARDIKKKTESGSTMDNIKQGLRVAMPLVEGNVCMHFGHCKEFALIDLDLEKREIIKTEKIDAPPHQPGLLPGWLDERGVNMVITGGMGSRAIGLFKEKNIEVITGAPPGDPQKIAMDYLNGTLVTTENVCDH